jgi:hypothetical protein
MCHTVLFQHLVEAGKFGAQLGAFVLRGLRGDEGAGVERGILEGTVEPEPELPCDLECGQGSAMVTRYGMAGGIAGAPYFAKELGNLARQNTLILQAAQQVVLGLLWRLIQTDLRRYELCQKLGELPQLEERGIRVIGKVALRKHAQTQELLVVLLQTGEVAGEKRWLMHHLVHVQPQYGILMDHSKL